jgi:hypothetical protein
MLLEGRKHNEEKTPLSLLKQAHRSIKLVAINPMAKRQSC